MRINNLHSVISSLPAVSCGLFLWIIVVFLGKVRQKLRQKKQVFIRFSSHEHLLSCDAFLRKRRQPASVPRWGCGGRRFKSSRPDQFTSNNQRLTGKPL